MMVYIYIYTYIYINGFAMDTIGKNIFMSEKTNFEKIMKIANGRLHV